MTTMPKRIQRSRAKGWKMPEEAVYVGRPTIWGNPFTIAAAEGYCRDLGGTRDTPRMVAVRWYREWLDGYDADPDLAHRRTYILGHISRLQGHDLACFCKAGEACHADILLELANREVRHGKAA